MSTWVQVAVMLLVVVVPAIAQAARKMQEQAEIRRARSDAKRAERDALRTGRSTPSTQPARPTPATATASTSQRPATNPRLQELAKRRQQQLEMLRRQQQRVGAVQRPQPQQGASRPPGPPRTPPPGARSGARPGAPYQTRSQPGQTPPTVARRPQPQTGADAKRRAAQVVAERQERLRAKKEAERAKTEKERARAQSRAEDDDRVAREIAEQSSGEDFPMRYSLTPNTPREWRQAIVLSEILQPPVSEREDQF